MGNSNTKLDKNDVNQLNNMSQGMQALRRSMESLPDSTRRYKHVIESNEKEIREILRRSTKGSTRRIALNMLNECEELRDKERSSIRDSSLDHGAIESSSIIAADVKKYDQNRQRDKNVDELYSLRRKLERIDRKIDRNNSNTSGESVELRKQLEVIMKQLDGIQVHPKSRLEDFRNETKNMARKCEKKLLDKQKPTSDFDGNVMSQLRNKQQTRPHSLGTRQSQQINMQNDIAMIQGKVLSLQSECQKFDGEKDSEAYNSLVQNLMKLWDDVGRIEDKTLIEQREEIIGTISATLKQMNHRCMDKTRGSLSKNKILSMVEIFHIQYQKIATWLNNGKVKEANQVYAILNEIQQGLQQLLNKNECQLVTTKLIENNNQLQEAEVKVYFAKHNSHENAIDQVYIQEEEEITKPPMKSNKSCPDFSIYPAEFQDVRATFVPPVLSTFKPQLKKTTSQQFEILPVLENLNFEVMTLKYAVEKLQPSDKQKFEELDERLIDLYIKIENLKGQCPSEEEAFRINILQQVQEVRFKLGKMHKHASKTEVSDEHKLHEHLMTIENVMMHLEILRTEINEASEWDSQNPEFKVLKDALQSHLMQVDLIESNGHQQLENSKQKAMKEIRKAMEHLDLQKMTAAMNGTEV